MIASIAVLGMYVNSLEHFAWSDILKAEISIPSSSVRFDNTRSPFSAEPKEGTC